MRARARSAHFIPDGAPLILEVGDKVEVAESSFHLPAFVFVTATEGEGWVPSRHLSIDSGMGVAITAYDTTELPVQPGDVLTAVERDDTSQWWWCRSDSGAQGWVPVEVPTPHQYATNPNSWPGCGYQHIRACAHRHAQVICTDYLEARSCTVIWVNN